MGVNIAAGAVGAFIALVLAVVLIIGTVMARRRGHIEDRHAIWILAIVIVVLIIYGLGFGVIRPW